MISRRQFLKMTGLAGAGAAAGSFWPTRVASGRAPGGPGKFRFVHYTDIHVQPELRGARGYAQAIHHINQHKPAFALSGGDLVFDTLSQDETRRDRLWKLYTTLTKEFDCPTFQTIGNHDNWAVNKKDVSPSTPGYGKQTYCQQLGLEKSYYSFDHEGWHFVVVDSIAVKDGGGWEPKVDSVQRGWLEDDLKAHRSQPQIIALHVPVMSMMDLAVNGRQASPSAGYIMSDSKELREIFEANNVRLVLQGHVHIREELVYNGVHYISNGAVSGSWWNGPRYGHPEGYAVIDIDGGNFEWTYHTYGWDAGKSA